MGQALRVVGGEEIRCDSDEVPNFALDILYRSFFLHQVRTIAEIAQSMGARRGGGGCKVAKIEDRTEPKDKSAVLFSNDFVKVTSRKPEEFITYHSRYGCRLKSGLFRLRSSERLDIAMTGKKMCPARR